MLQFMIQNTGMWQTGIEHEGGGVIGLANVRDLIQCLVLSQSCSVQLMFQKASLRKFLPYLNRKQRVKLEAEHMLQGVWVTLGVGAQRGLRVTSYGWAHLC